MTDVFYLRPIARPITADSLGDMAQFADTCFNLHKVAWLYSFVSADGGRMLCWYRAPDAESARIALRQLGSDMTAVWPGRVITDEGVAAPPDHRFDESVLLRANLLAEISLDEPLADEPAVWLESLKSPGIGDDVTTRFMLGFLSMSGTRLVCLFQGSDEEMTRATLDKANLRAASVWQCSVFSPSTTCAEAPWPSQELR